MFRTAVLAALSAGLLHACSEAPAPVELPPPSVGVHVVAPDTLTIHREFIGRTDAPDRVELRARVSGILEARDFDEGGEVERGQVLFRIERDTYQALVQQAAASVESAKATVSDAEVQLARMERLSVNRNVSEQDVDAARAAAEVARAALKGAEAALQQAELDLGRTAIDAPVSGRIGEAEIDVGNLVGPDSGVLATIVSLDPIHVRFTLSDVEYLAFRRDSQAGEAPPDIAPRLRLSDGEDYPHPGRLQMLANEIDPGTGTITARAVFANPDKLLRPGQFVTVVFEGTTGEAVLMAPQSAVLAGQDGHSVLVVGDDDVVEQRAVSVGEVDGDMQVITAGLEAGERLVVNGLQKVRPGQPVNVIDR